ncbi:MAG: flagellar hook-associated protein FlgK [Burkholderiales bacterium]|nr:flagellar hook-associated protein FlgK [Burkholderiales bacterium]
MSMLMQLGTRAMSAAYLQLQTTGQNIANANTPGYSRQEVVLGTSEGQFSGAGFVGRGVTVQTIVRAYDAYLTSQAAATKSVAAYDRARLSMLDQMQGTFGTGAGGLGNAATQLFNSFSDLAAAPADLAARQATIARAEDFASMARSYSDQIEVLQANVYNEVSNSVDEVNTFARGVADLNKKITAAVATGHSPNDLMDARDRLIGQISEKIDIETVNAPDGSISVYVGRGQSLVLRGLTNTVVTRQDEFDPARVSIGMVVSGELRPLDPKTLGAGAIPGLIKFQNEDLVDVRNRLGQMVASLATAMNDQQSFGIDLAGTPGDPLFQLQAAPALPAVTNALDGFGAPIAKITLTLQDETVLKASEYLLEEDPANPGLFQATRLSDGTVFSGLADGDTFEGFSFTFGATAFQTGDRFLLKPVSTAAMSVKVALADPRGLAAANPLTASSNPANLGTGSVGGLVIDALPGAAYQDMVLAFTSATGDYEIRDSGGGVLATGTWSASQPISYNGFSLTLKGVPANGDSFDIDVVVPPATNNGNALAFDDMANRLITDGRTINDAYAQTLSNVGVRVRGAEASAQTSAGVAQRAEEALTSKVGVNLDEEAARLIQFQQAYQAAAKMLQTAQSLMDMLAQLDR